MTHTIAWMIIMATCIVGPVRCCTVISVADEDSGTLITSSNFPDNYDNFDQSCWQVTSPSKVHIWIPEYEMEDEMDFLYLYDGSIPQSSALMASLTGAGVHESYNTSLNSLFLQFSSNSNITKRGFQACVCQSSVVDCSSKCIFLSLEEYDWRWNLMWQIPILLIIIIIIVVILIFLCWSWKQGAWPFRKRQIIIVAEAVSVESLGIYIYPQAVKSDNPNASPSRNSAIVTTTNYVPTKSNTIVPNSNQNLKNSRQSLPNSRQNVSKTQKVSSKPAQDNTPHHGGITSRSSKTLKPVTQQGLSSGISPGMSSGSRRSLSGVQHPGVNSNMTMMQPATTGPNTSLQLPGSNSRRNSLKRLTPNPTHLASSSNSPRSSHGRLTPSSNKPAPASRHK